MQLDIVIISFMLPLQSFFLFLQIHLLGSLLRVLILGHNILRRLIFLGLLLLFFYLQILKLFSKALFIFFLNLSEDFQLLKTLSLLILVLLLLPLNLELYLFLLTTHFLRLHLLDKFHFHSNLLLYLHHDQLLDLGLFGLRCEFLCLSLGFSFFAKPSLAFHLNGKKSIMVLIKLLGFRNLFRRRQEDEFWQIKLDIRVLNSLHANLLLVLNPVISRYNLPDCTGF